MMHEVDYPFKVYLNEYEPEYIWRGKKKKGELIKLVYNKETDEQLSKDTIFVADAYPIIERMELTEITNSQCEFEIHYMLSTFRDCDSPESCDIKFIRKSKTIVFLDDEFFLKLDEQNVTVGEKNLYRNLCKRYFRYVIQAEMSNFYSVKRVGWNKTDYGNDFIPVTAKGGWSDIDKSILGFIRLDENDISFFDGKRIENNKISGRSKQEIIEVTNSFQLFFDSLCNDFSIMGIFSYTIYAILFNYIYTYKIAYYQSTFYLPRILTDNFAFSISIWGKKRTEVQRLANIFSNIYYVDMKNDPSVRGKHSISATSLKTRLVKIMEYESIPLIVTSKTALSRNSYIVKRLHHYRECEKIRAFPVYLCEHPLNADEILDFDINESIKQIPKGNDLILLKDEISYLLLRFITYLSKTADRGLLQKPEERGKFAHSIRFFDELFIQTISEFEVNHDSNIEDTIYYVLLYAALKGFCHVLKYDLSLDEIAQKIEQQAYGLFFSDNSCIETNNIKQINDSQILYSFWNYLQELFKEEQSHKPYLHYTGLDKGKSFQGECYYLSFHNFFKGYKKYLKGAIPVSEETLKNLLKANNLLVLRENGKQISMQRRIDKKLETVLIIKKEAFDLLINRIISG